MSDPRVRRGRQGHWESGDIPDRRDLPGNRDCQELPVKRGQRVTLDPVVSAARTDPPVYEGSPGNGGLLEPRDRED